MGEHEEHLEEPRQEEADPVWVLLEVEYSEGPPFRWYRLEDGEYTRMDLEGLTEEQQASLDRHYQDDDCASDLRCYVEVRNPPRDSRGRPLEEAIVEIAADSLKARLIGARDPERALHIFGIRATTSIASQPPEEYEYEDPRARSLRVAWREKVIGQWRGMKVTSGEVLEERPAGGHCVSLLTDAGGKGLHD